MVSYWSLTDHELCGVAEARCDDPLIRELVSRLLEYAHAGPSIDEQRARYERVMQLERAKQPKPKRNRRLNVATP